MTKKHSRLESIGSYLPEREESLADLLSRMSYVPPFDYGRVTGIQSRHVHDQSGDKPEDSLDMALAAARDCLSRSSYGAEDLDVLISASITRFAGGYRQQYEPCLGATLGRELGAKRAALFDVSNACAGMFSGVYMLDRMIRSGMVKRGMVVSGECITPIADTATKEINEPRDNQFASLSVGDAAAAVIMDESVTEQDRIDDIDLVTCSEYARCCIGKPSDLTGTPALYTDNSKMHGTERLKMWPRFQKGVLNKRGTDFQAQGYDYVIFHQIGAAVSAKFRAVGEEVFETQMPESLQSIEHLGNSASTAHFVVLHEHLKNGKIQAGNKLLLVPAASGITTGSLSLTLSSLAQAS